MKTRDHWMILASAGCGKTHRLTTRFIELLARGEDPERIVALTFTRKAAGEFLDRILQRLSAAALDPAEARGLAIEAKMEGAGPPVFQELLRRLLDRSAFLSLGTLDSFFARIVRVFRHELGLGGDFAVMDDYQSAAERRRVLAGLFEGSKGFGSDQREFFEAFKQATFGREEKRLGAQLENVLNHFESVYVVAGAPSQWGEPGRIWRDGCPWLADLPALADALAVLGPLAADPSLSEKQQARWATFVGAVRGWSPGGDIPAEAEFILKKALAAWEDLRRGAVRLTIERKKQDLDAGSAKALSVTAAHLVASEIRRKLRLTRGVFTLLAQYDRRYDIDVRRQGRLSFADINRLLSPIDPLRPAPALSVASSDEHRLQIDYRLDARYDHWLLDEFQDTSLLQWRILSNLIDEAVQDPEGRRTFFYVGDVKQSIYGWRGGEPELFQAIYRQYNRGDEPAIRAETLSVSYRSAPPVLELVNHVFGDRELLASMFPVSAVDRWQSAWATHESARPGSTGHAAVLRSDDEEDRWRVTLELLLEIRPWERGLSCAVLARRNKTVAAITDYLRRDGGFAVSAEVDVPVAVDNPFGSALLDLLHWAAHPGDERAGTHWRMTPLGAILLERDRGEARLQHRLLDKLATEGFEALLAELIDKVRPAFDPDDEFTLWRARQILDVAAAFDHGGSRDIDEFRRYAGKILLRETDEGDAVRVMTVHKAKGLGFDIVILPDLAGLKLASRRDGLAVHKDEGRNVDWVLDPPVKTICRVDPVLNAQLETDEAEGCFANLALFYVALTRAKHGLYLIQEAAGGSKSLNFPKLVEEAVRAGEPRMVAIGDAKVPGVFETGDGDWFRAVRRAEPGAAATGPVVMGERSESTLPVLRPRRPSTEEAEVSGDRIFAWTGAEAAVLGRTVHTIFEQIDWLGENDEPAMAAQRAAAGVPGADPAAVSLVGACLESDEVQSLLRDPGSGLELWRERVFELVLENDWVTGVFDRVHLERDKAGRPVSARIIDFKTDRLDGEDALEQFVVRHREQMHLYRKCLSVLAGLPQTAIRLTLVAVQRGRVIEFSE